MSAVRYYVPNIVSNYAMYYAGKMQCIMQYYFNNEYNISKINDRMYIGDLASATNKDELEKTGITHIISVINGSIKYYPKTFEYKLIHINDDPWVKIEDYFDECIEFINEVFKTENTKIMIHCQKGISRSVTIMLAYLLNDMIKNKKNEIEITDESINNINKTNIAEKMVDEMVKTIQIYRPIAKPNEGFAKALVDYVVRLLDEKAI
jgi:protein-tyrosine phosphatase